MIRVNENYYIDVDERNYTVKIDKHKTDKDGKAIYETVGYYSKLEQAIKGVIGFMNKKQLCEGVHTLEQALEIVIANNKQFDELLERALN